MSDKTVPMIGPDGSVADVPIAGMPDAIRAGAKLGVDMVHAGSGERGVVPQDRYREAMAAGAVPYHSPAPAPALPEAGPVSRFLTAAGANLPTASGLLNMFRTAGNPTGIGPTGGVVQGFADDAARSPVPTAIQMQGHAVSGAVRQAAGLAGFNADSIASDARNGDYAGLAGDVLSPIAQTLAAAKLGAKSEPNAVSDAVQNLGTNAMNRVVLNAKPRNMKFGANPGQAVLENTSGFFPSKGAMASSLDDALHNKVGPQIGEAYRKADNAGTTISPQELSAAIQPALQKARTLANGPGGSASRAASIDELEQSLSAYTDPNRAPLSPSEVWRAKQMLDRNTPWKDFTQRDLNTTKQQVSSGIGGLLDSKIPELSDLNRSYQGLVQASKLAAERNARTPSIFGTAVQSAAGGELAHLLGSSPAYIAGGVIAPAALRSVPVQSGIATGLYRGGAALRSLPSAARSAAILNTLKQVPANVSGDDQQ